MALAVVIIVASYHRALNQLLAFVGSDTPLAYVGLVPFIVFVVCLVKGRPQTGELRTPDRDLDWIIGLPLLAVAGAIAFLLPERLSYPFWTNRVDLLGLPFFAAGVVAILFGARVVWRLRLPLTALFLAWPYPWIGHVNGLLAASQHATVAAVRTFVPVLGGVEHVAGSKLVVDTKPEQLMLDVGPICAGANRAVGFLLIGGAALFVLRGRRRAKVMWVGVGLMLVLTLNVARILLIFWVGRHLGASVALEWFHPYAGLGFLALASAVMVALLPRFGIGGRRLAQPPPRDPNGAPRLLTSTATLLVGILALTLGMANAGLRQFDPFLGIGSTGRLAPISARPPELPGWAVARYGEVRWAPQFFGGGATWLRYAYNPAGAASGGAVYMDVVSTDDLGRFSRYGLEACYRFHDYRVVDSRRLDVGGPAVGQSITFYSRNDRTWWAAVSWVSPVTDGRYERVVLLTTPSAGALDDNALADGLRAKLQAFAHELSARQRDTPA